MKTLLMSLFIFNLNEKFNNTMKWPVLVALHSVCWNHWHQDVPFLYENANFPLYTGRKKSHFFLSTRSIL